MSNGISGGNWCEGGVNVKFSKVYDEAYLNRIMNNSNDTVSQPIFDNTSKKDIENKSLNYMIQNFSSSIFFYRVKLLVTSPFLSEYVDRKSVV